MIIAVCNQKGGVGKTTLATNIAARLASHAGSAGKAGIAGGTGMGRVLLVDADPQGNASTTVGIDVGEDTLTLNDVLAAVASGHATAAQHAICRTSWEGVDVIPSDRLLASRNEDTSLGRESRLRSALHAITHTYQHMVIDCPPTLGMLTTNALVAADRALIVTTARETAIDGVADMISTIATIRSYYNPHLELTGILLNSYRDDRLDRRQWKQQLHEYYGAYVIKNDLPERELIATAGTNHTAIPHGKDFLIDQALDATISHILTTH